MSVHNHLKSFRLNSGMTQEEVAEKMNVTRQAISSYETGRTRPDIDMLVRFAELYHADLESILHGTDKAIKAQKRICVVSIIVLTLCTLLTMLGSALMLYANRGFSVAEGIVAQEIKPELDAHFQIMKGGEICSGLAMSVAVIGFLVLLCMLISGKNRILFSCKVVYLGAFAIGQAIASIPFAIGDPVFPLINYVMVPIHVVCYGVIFFVAACLIEWFKKRKK